MATHLNIGSYFSFLDNAHNIYQYENIATGNKNDCFQKPANGRLNSPGYYISICDYLDCGSEEH